MIRPDDIIITTVTYGQRWELLSKSIKSCILQGISNFIIVGNGVGYDIKSMIGSEFSGLNDISFHLICKDTNEGSALGYKAALLEAMKRQGEYIMIIDDDAELQPDCIKNLITTYDQLIKDYDCEDLVLSALRIEHDSDIKEGILESSLKRRSAFRRFHLLELLKRVMYMFGIKCSRIKEIDKIYIPYTVYSGLFLNRLVLEKYGLPNTSFVLYGDDLEFTYRITSRGGKIFLIPHANISDLQMSWWCRKSFGNPFDALILGGLDKLVYYAFRNEVYFEKYCLKKSGPIYLLHKYLYIFVLFLNSLRRRRLDRFKIIIEALRDGNKGRLGVNEKYPLH